MGIGISSQYTDTPSGFRSRHLFRAPFELLMQV